MNNTHSLWKKEGIEKKTFMLVKNKTVVFLRSTPIAPEPRIEKDAIALLNAGYRVIVVERDETLSFSPLEQRNGIEIQR